MNTNPRLRPLDATWIDHNGQPGILLRDRLGISTSAAVVPRALVPILPLCDGSRSLQAIRSVFELRTGIPISLSAVQQLAEQLDEALLLDSPRFREAYQACLEEYRAAPFRPATLAGHVYPADPDDLEQALGQYGEELGDATGPAAGIRGIVCPHIDYARGGPMYAAVWRQAARAARNADLVLVFGTDHAGDGPGLNLTGQSYATPWGILPTEKTVVEDMAAVLGNEDAFSHELHHRNEHSIEMAMVWLHYTRRRRACPVVPILCGSVQPGDSGQPGAFRGAIDALRMATKGRRVLAVAAADLAHVGPVFGDPSPFGPQEQSGVASEDEKLLSVLCAGDAEAFLGTVMADGDRRRVCGTPPVYALLHYLNGCRGEITGYTQCPADASGGSFVSIAGAILR